MDNLHAALDAPTALNVTVQATRRREVRRSSRPREYLTEREIEKLMDAARGNRWGHRDATAILLAYRHGRACRLALGRCRFPDR
jgi:integrase